MCYVIVLYQYSKVNVPHNSIFYEKIWGPRPPKKKVTKVTRIANIGLKLDRLKKIISEIP